jgi:hypothetical protein
MFESAGPFSQANPEPVVASISKRNRIDHSSNRKTSTRKLQRTGAKHVACHRSFDEIQLE